MQPPRRSAGPATRLPTTAPRSTARSRACRARTPRSRRRCSTAACRCRAGVDAGWRRSARERPGPQAAEPRRRRPDDVGGREGLAAAGRDADDQPDKTRRPSAVSRAKWSPVRRQGHAPKTIRCRSPLSIRATAPQAVATATLAVDTPGEGFVEITARGGALRRGRRRARGRAVPVHPPHLGVAHDPGERRSRRAHRSASRRCGGSRPRAVRGCTTPRGRTTCRRT